jgi:methionyl-tRNA formyltransferase
MEEIYAVGGSLDLVITLKDELAVNKSGRIYADSFCREHNIELLKTRNINDDEAVKAVREREIDWLFIIGWSQIARSSILGAPKRGVLGMHPTLLPVGRGRAAIPWAIIKGVSETGVTLFQLDEGVDTGPVIAQERLKLTPDETATSLYSRVTHAHQKLIRRVWGDLSNDRLTPIPQDERKASIWPGRTPEDGRITSTMTVNEVDRLVRATTAPYPGAFWVENGEVLKIWRGAKSKPKELPPAGVRVLRLSDGDFYALEYVSESHPASQS